MKRFISEYANYKIRDFKSNPLMRDGIKAELIGKINKVLKLSDRGLITVDEAVRLISEV